MKKSGKKTVYVAYDKDTGAVVLTHQSINFDPQKKITQKQIQAEINKTLTHIHPGWKKNILITKINIEKERLATLSAINLRTKRPIKQAHKYGLARTS